MSLKKRKIRDSHISLESLNPEEEKKLLDNDLLKNAEANSDVDLKMNENEDEWKDKNDANIVPPKMNTLVGLIRITNFASATTVVFILVMAVMQEEIWKENPMQNMLSSVQLIFLSLMALLVYIDSIGTISFCWREYGELSALHTDATSIIFILCSNRWVFRLATSILFLTSLNLPVMDQLKHDILPDSLYWVVGLIASSLVANLIGVLLSICVPSHR